MLIQLVNGITTFLFVGRLNIKDPLIKKFRSFSELKKYAKAAPDPELLGKIKVRTDKCIGRVYTRDALSVWDEPGQTTLQWSPDITVYQATGKNCIAIMGYRLNESPM